MSNDDVQQIRDWMKGMSADITAIRTEGAETLKMVNHINARGCARSDTHDMVDRDHENRLRSVEVTIEQSRGAFKMAHLVTGLVGAVLMFVAKKIWP